MPIYEYQCVACNHHFDVIQKMDEIPIKTCPHCSADKAIRLISAAGFQLKGSGWYATDFKTKDKSLTSSDKSPAEATSTTEVSTPVSKGSDES